MLPQKELEAVSEDYTNYEITFVFYAENTEQAEKVVQKVEAFAEKELGKKLYQPTELLDLVVEGIVKAR
ncbi:MAG: hypothetical protein ACOCQR_03695 [bacterium]